MTLVATQGVWMPAPPPNAGVPAFSSVVIDAATEKFAWIGQVFNKDRTSKNITKVGFLPGAITSAGGSTMRLSLQNVDTATGQPARPDGTQDQTVDFLASAPTASTWYKTAALSATRTVTYGEWVAVVLEFQSFAGADVFNVQNHFLNSSAQNLNSGVCVAYIGAPAWAQQTQIPNIVFEFDDGTFGTFDEMAFPASVINTHTFATGSTPDEVALRFTVPFKCKVDGAWISASIVAAGRSFDVVLYEGTTARLTASPDPEYANSTTGKTWFLSFGAEYELAAGTVYYLAFKPTTANNCTTYSTTVAEANHFQAMPGGTAWHYGSRTDAGAWTDVTTQRLIAGIRISALDDGASALGHGNMTGGMQ